MKLSAKNQLEGKVTDIKKGPISSEVTIDVNGISIISSITTGSVEELNLKIGDEATAVVKASSIMIAK